MALLNRLNFNKNEKTQDRFPQLQKQSLLGRTRNLRKVCDKALADLGHEVTVFSGPPYPELDSRVKLEVVPSLDLYSKDSKFKDVNLKDLLIPINFFEWFSINSGGFAEPYTFGKRIKKF